MSKIIDAASVSIADQRVFLDANVWLLTNGFSANASPERVGAYSAALSNLLKKNNKIILNDYVLGEFFNRSVKIEYDIRKAELHADGEAIPSFKRFRASADFAPVLEAIRDTCLNMLEDYEFVSVTGAHYDIETVVKSCCSDCVDFSDLVLIEFCRSEKLFVMTDDADYSECGLNIITANRRIRA